MAEARKEMARWSRKDTGAVRTIGVRSFRRFLERMGIEDAEALIWESGLDPDQLLDPDALFSFRACADMFVRAARATGRETLGLDFGLQLPWADLGVLGYVMFNSPSLEAGLDGVSRFYSSMRIFGDFLPEVKQGEARYSFSPQGTEPGATPQNSYVFFTFLVRFCREATGQPDLAPRKVCFAHAAPKNAAPLEEFFRAPIQFSAPRDSFTLPREVLGLKLGASKPDLLPGLRRHAQRLVNSRRPAADDVDRVRDCVTLALGEGIFQIDEIAVRIGLSARTLQRRLNRAGTNYQQVLGEARLALAQLYLKDPSMSLPEIAFLLGYSYQSVMSRAYRRWAGESPTAFRKS
jgi:AraC-like DNA-binding protein